MRRSHRCRQDKEILLWYQGLNTGVSRMIVTISELADTADLERKIKGTSAFDKVWNAIGTICDLCNVA